MRFGLAIIAATSFACYAPAFAQADSIVALTPGQSAVLTVAGKGEARVVQRGRGEWTPHDLAAARHLVRRCRRRRRCRARLQAPRRHRWRATRSICAS